MQNNLPLQEMNLADLEAFIIQVIDQERPQQSPATDEETFLKTFGAWQSEHPAEAIVEDIYQARDTPNLNDISAGAIVAGTYNNNELISNGEATK